MPKWMEAGQITGVHGIAGEVKVRPFSNDAKFLLQFKRLALQEKGGERVLTAVDRSRVHQDFLLLKLQGVDDRDRAQALRQAMLYFDRDEVQLPEGQYFLAELIGLEVLTEEGRVVGTVTQVFQPPAQDVYEITGADGVHMIPAVPEFVLSIDMENRRMTVRLIEGM